MPTRQVINQLYYISSPFFYPFKAVRKHVQHAPLILGLGSLFSKYRVVHMDPVILSPSREAHGVPN